MVESQRAKVLSLPCAHESKPSSADRPLLLSDPISQRLQRELQQLAPSCASVLIIGETGTGKELTARHIHDHSRRAGPFVAVNCGAFNESLAESELFGHELGAFTGAHRARAGWFEAAHGGTLFLDEIGEMPVGLQVKLLRVLQERQVVRIGARAPIGVDVRVVSATNVDLEEAISAGRFRRDLYYRLNVASVRLRPLRERPADILPLARYFIELFGSARESGPPVLSGDAEQALLHHDWPGNIRELENVIHLATILCTKETIGIDVLRLPEAPRSGSEAVVARRGITNVAPRDGIGTLQEGIDRLLGSERMALFDTVARQLLISAFEHCGGNQVQTAKRLGISRNVVRAQLKRYGLLDSARACPIPDANLVQALAIT